MGDVLWEPKYELRDYQKQAVAFLREGNGGKALFLDMGLGKTASCLSALTKDHLPAVVLAPKRVAETVWGPERDLWAPDLSITCVVGSRKQREAALAIDADITVISRDNQADLLEKAATGYFRTVIIDELSGYKNRNTVRHKTARRICKFAEHVWGLTGTPTPKSLVDLWAQILLLDKGKALGKTLTGFRNTYFRPAGQLPNGIVTGWEPRCGKKTEEDIYKLLEPIVLSQGTEGRVKLPPVNYLYHSVKLPGEVRSFYEKLKKDQVAKLAESGEEITAVNAAVVSGKLAQVTAGFAYHNMACDASESDTRAYDELHSEKLDILDRIIASAEGSSDEGSPVLVFYRFKAELEMLQKRYGTDVHTVKEKDFAERWNRGELPILAAHPASIGHGLNLQHGGYTAVWISLPWSSEEYLQSNKRLARSGQKHTVTIHHIMAEDSIDGHVFDKLTHKVDAQQRLLDYLKDD